VKPPPKISLNKLDKLEEWLTDLWKLVELNACKIQTISYTGDDSTSKTITTNFVAKIVLVWMRPEDNTGSACAMWMRSDLSSDQASFKHLGLGGHQGEDNSLIAIDTTTPGFTVDDGGSNNNPNKNGVVYHALVLG